MISTSPSWPASPCSTAFVTSSVSASASGVAYSLGSVPKRPVECVRARVFGRRGDLGDELQHAGEHLVEVDVLRQPLRERVVHDGDRRHAPHRLGERLARLVGVRATRLDAQQRRDRLQVVLDAVVDLADRRVLGDELLLLVADLRHVAAQHDRADARAVIAQRDRPQRHRDTRAPRCRCARARGRSRRPAATRRTAASPAGCAVVTSTSDSPSSSSSKPSRLNADSAFGLAKVVMPSTSSRIRPSDARGAPRRGAVGAERSGKSPEATIPKRSSAQSLNVICWRDGVRVSPRFVCRVSTPIVIAAVPLCARDDRHGAHAGRRLLEPVRRRGVDDAARSGRPRAPACATAAARGRRRCRGRRESPRRSVACGRRRRTSRRMSAPRSRCRRTPDRRGADRRRRDGAATPRRSSLERPCA